MNYPEYVKIGEKKYKINTDFRVAIECNNIAEDETIGDYERALAIIYKIFGEEALNDFENHEQLLNLAQKYLSCGNELDSKNNNEEPDFDFNQDIELVRISFMSDYNGLDIKEKEMHFWEFMDRINGLSNSELGDCCVLNRVRNIRNYDLKDLKDPKERKKIIEAKKQVALKKNKKKRKLTDKEKTNVNEFMKKAGLSGKE